MVETGNHVFQIGEGSARRRCAEVLKTLRRTAAGEAPRRLHECIWDSILLTALWVRMGTLEETMSTWAELR